MKQIGKMSFDVPATINFMLKHLVSKQQWDGYITFKHVYIEDDVIVATVNVNEYDNNDAQVISAVYVHEDYRNKGIGTMIINDITNNDNPMSLEVDRDNLIAIKLYEKFGFHYWQDEDDKMIWMKNFKYNKI